MSRWAKVFLFSTLLATVDSTFAQDTICTVYNFEVANTHNYFVGNQGVLVHNGVCDLDALRQFLAGKFDKIDDLINDIKNLPNHVDLCNKIKNGTIDPKAWQVLQTATSTARHSTEVLEKLTLLLKKNRFGWTDVEFQKVFNKLSKTLKKGDEVIGETIDGEVLKAKIGDMLSESDLLDAIKAMDNLAVTTNAEKVLKELCCESDWKFVGAEMVMRYLQKENLWGKVKVFELYDAKRYIDIVLNKQGGGIIRVEVKSWIKIYKKSFLAQFAKDLDAITNLDELRWVFDNKYGSALKSDVMAVLNSSQGQAALRTVDKFSDKVKKFFPNETVNDDNFIDVFLKKLDEENNFNNVFITK